MTSKHKPDCGCVDCSVVVEPAPPTPTADEVWEARGVSAERCCRTCTWWQKEVSGYSNDWARGCTAPLPQYYEDHRLNTLCFADSGKKCRVWKESDCTCGVDRPTQSAPTDAEVREAVEELKCGAVLSGNDSYYAAISRTGCRTILAALTQAQEGAKMLTKKLEVYRGL